MLRIGRTSAYQLAKQWCYTDGREGLPVVRVGRLLRVPRHALERLARGDLSMWRSRPAWWRGLRRRTDGRVTVSADTAPSTLLQPRQRHSIVAMSWGEVELEPEVRAWYLSLDEDNQARVQFNVDRLAERGPLLDEPFTKQLDGKLRELRFYLDGRPTRVTNWIASGRRIILLTVFVKSQRPEHREASLPSASSSIGSAPRPASPRRGWPSGWARRSRPSLGWRAAVAAPRSTRSRGWLLPWGPTSSSEWGRTSQRTVRSPSSNATVMPWSAGPAELLLGFQRIF